MNGSKARLKRCCHEFAKSTVAPGSFSIAPTGNKTASVHIASILLKKNCFPYETAFENFRDEEVSEEVINSFLYDFQHMEESDITEQKIKRCFIRKTVFLKHYTINVDSKIYINKNHQHKK